jgi:6-phosphogluconolactonase
MGSIHFFKITDVGFIAQQISESIRSKLAEGRDVVWLLSGGSAITVAVEAASLLADEGTPRLTVGLIDERYGKPGHTDSNWSQLEAAGFKLEGIDLAPMIKGLDFIGTTKEYDKFIAQIAGQNSYKIGLLGMGADGHTAGILPYSPVIDSNSFVGCYEAADYRRVTLTGKGLRILDKAIVYAAGAAKRSAIENLTKSMPAAKQPAQLLKRIADVDVYNDVIGDSI